MLMEDYLHIKMCIKRTTMPDPEYIDFTPEEYFDIDEDEPLDVDSVPKFMKLLDYLKEKNDVYYISLIVDNQDNKRKLHFETNYYDHQNSLFSIVTEYLHHKVCSRELIIDMLIPSWKENAIATNDISRFHQKNGEGEFLCIDHSIITTFRDGTQESIELPCHKFSGPYI